ncbi:PGF-CTERM-anchored ABC transporter substrate-binding protein [Natrinema halophilum]|uniref:ABC transporter substrate-binding protein n=1 Tax=Natrinema halophilum TaxID=1699371 RepID=A0A7D5KJ60_9EURY|nr:PGF-CTERM-anchored ABC transporter substrate-binding protein [Natrinema halophilum]QLG47718.1 PGF-CTERM-anchored ABC transporter substrate-binding protein [Natrinema halophilum]
MRHRVTALMAVLLVSSVVGPAVVTTSGATGPAVQETNALQESNGQCEYPLTMTDARGMEVTLESEPESIVTLYPGDAQLAYSIGAEGKVVGMPVSKYTESLDAGDRTDITKDDGVTPVAEKIVRLDPDVVLAANVATYNQGLLDTLENAGITVVVLDTANSMDGVRTNVRVTGNVTGHCAGAQETIQWMNERLEIYDSALEGEEKPLAYYASGEDGATFGSETFQHDVLTTAGLTNLAAEAGETGWVQINSEVVVDRDPKWIVYPDRADSPPMPGGLDETTAVQENNVVAVDNNAMSQPGPNVVYAIESIVEQVHPDVYAEIEGDLEAVDEKYSDEGNTSDSESPNDGDNESAIPGFGVPAALVALLAAVSAVAGRR